MVDEECIGMESGKERGKRGWVLGLGCSCFSYCDGISYERKKKGGIRRFGRGDGSFYWIERRS